MHMYSSAEREVNCLFMSDFFFLIQGCWIVAYVHFGVHCLNGLIYTVTSIQSRSFIVWVLQLTHRVIFTFVLA